MLMIIIGDVGWPVSPLLVGHETIRVLAEASTSLAVGVLQMLWDLQEIACQPVAVADCWLVGTATSQWLDWVIHTSYRYMIYGQLCKYTIWYMYIIILYWCKQCVNVHIYVSAACLGLGRPQVMGTTWSWAKVPPSELVNDWCRHRYLWAAQHGGDATKLWCDEAVNHRWKWPTNKGI